MRTDVKEQRAWSDSQVDLDPLWMPFTGNREFKLEPRMMVAADGMHYTRDDGARLLDSTAGLWCVNAGHGREPIISAIQAQAARLDYAPSFQLGHPDQFRFAERLVGMAPDGMGHVFFTNSGSEAVDTALKIALAYQQLSGNGSRHRLIGRERGYHGVGFGGISVGGIVSNRKHFGTLLSGVDHLPHTHAPEHNAFCKGVPEWGGAQFANALESLVDLHDASTIAAVIVEPVAGSTGVLVPPAGYLQRLREICDQHGILLIFDEVITGFGRLGAPFAADYFGVTPDVITLAKGLTNGAVPMGAVLVRDEIYQTFVDNTAAGIELFHGYTYSGHPLACAAGMATLDIYEQEGLFDRASELSRYWEDALHSLRDIDSVIDLRNIGLVAGIELDPLANQPGTRAFEVFKRCFNDEGLLIRVTGDIIALSPPLIITREQIDQIFETLGRVLRGN